MAQKLQTFGANVPGSIDDPRVARTIYDAVQRPAHTAAPRPSWAIENTRELVMARLSYLVASRVFEDRVLI